VDFGVLFSPPHLVWSYVFAVFAGGGSCGFFGLPMRCISPLRIHCDLLFGLYFFSGVADTRSSRHLAFGMGAIACACGGGTCLFCFLDVCDVPPLLTLLFGLYFFGRD
jgi:hypothetical protein